MPLNSLLRKLLLAILLPTLLTFAAFGFLAHWAARRALEAELGRRLAGIAAAAAAQISEESVAILAPGDEQSRTYRNLRRRLQELRDANQVARLYLFDQALTSRVDTEDVPVGARYYGLDVSRAELKAVFGGRPASSLLFRGRDGRLYKSGYAPLAGAMGAQAQFAVAVDGSAALYEDLLGLRRTLWFVGASGVLAMVLLALVLSARLSRPLRELTATARRIGQGELHQPVPARVLSGRDEVAVLAQAFESMREALRSRDERLQMMLSGIAHEVRNPLGGMELFCGLLREELAAEQPDLGAAAGYEARVEREIGHLKAVVNDFLEYARRPRLLREPVALLQLLREVADAARAQAPAGVRVTAAADGGDAEAAEGLRALGDEGQLRRALLNLAHNAVQACAAAPAREGGHHVRLTLQRAGEALRVEVCDSGAGIAAEALPRIFVPFFTTKQQGTGLGLAFVKEIVTEHGGAIEVDTGPGGTCFRLRLPGV